MKPKQIKPKKQKPVTPKEVRENFNPRVFPQGGKHRPTDKEMGWIGD